MRYFAYSASFGRISAADTPDGYLTAVIPLAAILRSRGTKSKPRDARVSLTCLLTALCAANRSGREGDWLRMEVKEVCRAYTSWTGAERDYQIGTFLGRG